MHTCLGRERARKTQLGKIPDRHPGQSHPRASCNSKRSLRTPRLFAPPGDLVGGKVEFLLLIPQQTPIRSLVNHG
eukprot:1192151-Prorocentrum_minimum.AAC.4